MVEKKHKLYIDYLNKDANFKKSRIYFLGDTYENALINATKWGKKNLSNFNDDMVYELKL